MRSLKQFMLYVMFFLSIIIGLYFLMVSIEHPYIGIMVKKAPQNTYKVSDVANIGLAKYYQVRPGDIILKVNGMDPGDSPIIQRFLTVEQSKSIVIQNEEGIRTINFDNGQNLSKQFFLHVVFPGVVFLLNLLLSLLIFFKKKDYRYTPVFILLFLWMGILYINGSASSRNDIFAVIMIMGMIFLPVLLLHFMYLYFKEYGLELFHKKILTSIYIFNAIVILTYLIMLGLVLGEYFYWIREFVLIVFSTNLFIGILIMLRVYIRYRKTAYSPIFRLLSWGLFISFFPFVGFYALPMLIFGNQIIEGEVSALFIVFFPLIFMYLIMANRLLDIDFVLGRIRYYSVLSIFSTVIIWLFLHDLIRIANLNSIQWAQIIIFTFILNIIFLYIKEEMDYRFRFKLFAKKYDYQASLNRFSRHLSKVMKISNLEEAVINEVKDVLSIKKVSILEITKENYLLSLKKGDINFPYDEIRYTFKNYMGTFEVGELMELKQGTCAIIGGDSNKVNILWFEDRLNRIQLNHNEKEWLTTLARHIGIVYENMHLIEGLFNELEEMRERNKIPPWMLRFLFNIQEKERRRLSADLHDSALQEQLIWYRRLETVVESHHAPDEMDEELVSIKEGLLDVIHQIRETCNELRPPFLLEMGIVEALDNLFTFAQLRNDYIIEFDAKHFRAKLDDEYSLVVYRIIQELLSNAAKHSRASVVEIKLESRGESVHLSYKDNGIGMELSQVAPSYHHIGISAIKERVHSLEGKISFISAQGQGLQVFVTLPLRFLREEAMEENYIKQM